jgi:hypothetical protein
MKTKNKISRIGELKKVETMEDFRETLLKLFVSNQEKREIYLKPTILSKFYDENKGRPFYYPVDNINSYSQIFNIGCKGTIKIKDEKFQNTENYWDLEDEEILNFDIIEDDNEFIDKSENSYWMYIGSGKPIIILQTICSSDFMRKNLF